MQLDQGQAVAAFTTIERYRAEFPDGQHAERLAALRIEARCRMDQRELARRDRARFVARWPSSPYLPVIDRTCGGASP